MRMASAWRLFGLMIPSFSDEAMAPRIAWAWSLIVLVIPSFPNEAMQNTVRMMNCKSSSLLMVSNTLFQHTFYNPIRSGDVSGCLVQYQQVPGLCSPL